MSLDIGDAPSSMTCDGALPESAGEELQSLAAAAGSEKAEKGADAPDKARHRHHSPALRPGECSPLVPRDQRSSSDAHVHAVSKSRAAAAAALARSSHGPLPGQGCRECHHHPLLSPQLHPHRLHPHPPPPPHHHHHLRPHPHPCPVHRSHGSLQLPGSERTSAGGGDEYSGAQTHTRRSHSQSSLARLLVKPKTDHSRSTSSLSRSRHALGPEEEVTYVWRNGRVQVQQPHAARNGGKLYSEHRTSAGQHVEYLWQCGNVQKVIRGSNNEMLSAEVVPPRGQVNGAHYCIVFCLLVFFVVTIIALVFVLKGAR